MSAVMELLAPAGSPDAGYAALAYGADAVYLGLPRFSARATADNFSFDQLRPFVGYAHGMMKPRKVYVAINTLLRGNEIPELLDALGLLSEIGVDSVIVQDLGVLRLVRDSFPELAIHASTQMAIHSAAGAAFLKQRGIRRVILARELSRREVKAVAHLDDLEAEVFIHGALCYAYSGLCLLSSHLRGRSGNRGECSYLCRERFSCGGGDTCHPMSMKDLALPETIEYLRDAGVTSLKIEGRKKSPLYVAAVTDYYRKLIDGGVSEDALRALESDVNTIFAREQTALFMQKESKANLTTRQALSHHGARIGFVSRFIFGKDGRDRIRFTLENRSLEKYDGLQLSAPENDLVYGFCAEKFWAPNCSGRGLLVAHAGDVIEVELPAGHPRIPVGAMVSCTSSNAVKRSYSWETPRPQQWTSSIPLSVSVTIAKNGVDAVFNFTIHDQTVEVARSHRAEVQFSLARKDPETIGREAFSKLGGTPFVLEELSVQNPDALFVPTSTLNQLRRSLVEASLEEMHRARLRRLRGIVFPTPHAGEDFLEQWSVKVDKLSYLATLEPAERAELTEVIVACSKDAFEEDLFYLADQLGVRDRIRLSLPPIVRDWENAQLIDLVNQAREHGIAKWQVSNPSGITLLEGAQSEMDIQSDWQLYAMNPFAVAELESWGMTGFTASPEDFRKNLKALVRSFPAIWVPVYQDTPLAISEACIHADHGGCADCGERENYRELTLTSQRDNLLAITRHCRTVTVSKTPYSLSPELDDLRECGAKRFRMDFAWRAYEPESVAKIIREVRSGRFNGGHTANYRRGAGD